VGEGADPEGGKFLLALDKEDIKISGNTKTAWLRQTFANPKTLPNGNTFQELFINFIINCSTKKFTIKTIGMSSPETKDFVHTVNFLENSKEPIWKDIPDNKPSNTIYQELCVWYKSLI